MGKGENADKKLKHNQSPFPKTCTHEPKLNTVKPVLETTCIKGPLASKDHCSDTTTLLKSI